MFGIEDFSKKIVDYGNFSPSQLADALKFGGAVLLIGILAIFAVLSLLWLCLSVFKDVFASIQEKGKQDAKANEDVSATPAYEPESDDSEIVAVIAAAIAMAESEGSGAKFKVVSFKRK